MEIELASLYPYVLGDLDQLGSLIESDISLISDFLENAKLIAEATTNEEAEQTQEKIVDYLLQGPVSLLGIKYNATDLLKKTGYLKLDRILRGGLKKGELMEIYGKASTGKTEFCHNLISNICLSTEEKKTGIYFDFKGQFSPKRILQIAQKPPKYLARIQVIKDSSLASVIRILQEIEESLNGKGSLFYSALQIIILDSLPAIFYQLLRRSYHNNMRIGEEQVITILKRIAHNYGIIIIVINHGVSQFFKGPINLALRDKNVKPALGQYWTHIADHRFYFANYTAAKPVKRQVMVSLHKSVRIQCPKRFVFTITNDGIC